MRLYEVEKKINALAKKINVPAQLLPTFGYSEDFARPHLEKGGLGSCSYVIIERGAVLEKIRFWRKEVLLYKVFETVTHAMASDYASQLKNREGDFRRASFAKQAELMGELSYEWKLKVKREHQKILQKNPFR